MLRTLVFIIALLSSSFALASSCFNPRNDPVIKRYLAPDPEFNETANTIEQMHQLIWSFRPLIDPRLVYYRMIGESGADPFAINPSSKAYGMFQFLGSPYRDPKSHRQHIEDMYRDRPNESPRLLQLEYYLKNYVMAYIAAANMGVGCNRNKKFIEYTNLEKVSYLGWGSCTQSVMQNKELAHCQDSEDYNGACAFTSDLLTESNPLPLCR